MILINLAPPAALKDKIWFVPELILFILVSAISWTNVQWYLSSIEDEIRQIQSETAEVAKDLAKLHSDVEKFGVITSQIAALKEKLASLEDITVSKVGRYLPIIVLEHLQTLKPEGLWFKSLRQDSDSREIALEGGSFDNLLIAEFMSSIDETRRRPIDTRDVRSMVYFPIVKLGKISSDAGDQQEAPNKKGPETDTQKAFRKTSEIKDAEDQPAKEIKGFPELEKFPAFSLTIKYAERSLDPATPKRGQL